MTDTKSETSNIPDVGAEIKPRVTRSSVGGAATTELKEEQANVADQSSSSTTSGRSTRSQTGTPTNDVNDQQNSSSAEGPSSTTNSLKRKLSVPTNPSTAASTRRLRSNKLNTDEESDTYCWICRKDGVVLSCALCPRVYHVRCLGMNQTPTENDWICVECEKVMRSECEDTRPVTLVNLGIEQLNTALQYALERMKVPNSEVFQVPVDPTLEPEYHRIIAHPMDMSTLERNIKKKQYASPDAFLADAKWILHNCIVYNGVHNKYTATCKNVLKVCRTQMMEIDTCPDCYLNSCIQDTHWFCKPCRQPHPLVWAKLKGYPYWPAKAVKEVDGQVDCRFFGAHDRAWVTASQVLMLSKEPPAVIKNKKGIGFDGAMLELDRYIVMYKAKVGSFQYAGMKEPYITESPPSPADKKIKLSVEDGISDTKNKSPDLSESTQLFSPKDSAVGIDSAQQNLDSKMTTHFKDATTSLFKDTSTSPTPTVENKPTLSCANVLPPSDNVAPSAQKDSLPLVKEKLSSVIKAEPSSSGFAPNHDEKDLPLSESLALTTENAKDEIKAVLSAAINAPITKEKPSIRFLSQTQSSNKAGVFTISDDLLAGAESNYDFSPEECAEVQNENTLVNKLEQKMKCDESEEKQDQIDTGGTTLDSTAPPAQPTLSVKDGADNVQMTDEGPDLSPPILPAATRAEFTKNLLTTIESCKSKLGIQSLSDAVAEEDGSSSGSEDSEEVVSSGVSSVDDATCQVDSKDTTRQSKHLVNEKNITESVAEQSTANGASTNKSRDSLPSSRFTPATDFLTAKLDCSAYMRKMISAIEDTFNEMMTDAQFSAIPRKPNGQPDQNLKISQTNQLQSHTKQIKQKPNEFGQTSLVAADTTLGKEQLEKLAWKHKCEIDAIKHNADLTAVELKKSIELEKERALWRLRKQLEHKYKKLVEETKKKQWCAMCGKEAIFYCCWNTSYCDYPCQQKHWPNHLKSCAQLQKDSAEGENASVKQGNQLVASVDRMLPSKPQIPVAPPAYTGNPSESSQSQAPPQVSQYAVGPHQQRSSTVVQYMPVPSGSVYQTQVPLQAVTAPTSTPVLYPVMQQAPGAHPPPPQGYMVSQRQPYKLAPKY